MLPLSRKYRPLSFAQIVGQAVVVRTLKNAITLKRLHPVYIFTGTRGVGKTTTARILAKALNCEKGPTPDPCLICPSCREIAEGRSLDVLEIDAASHTRVEETREILEQVPYAPARGRYRVFIIDEAHMLSRSSFNALLKTLEEPPPHALFILATTEPEKIPDTVRSRAQEFPFYPLPQELIAEEITRILTEEGIPFEPPAVKRLAHRARGSLRDALSLCDQVLTLGGGNLKVQDVDSALGLTSEEEIREILQSLFRFDPPSLLKKLLHLKAVGKLNEEILHDLYYLLFEEIEERVRSGTGGSEVRLEDLFRLSEGIHRILLEVRRSSVPEIYITSALLKLSLLKPIGNLEEVIQKILAPSASSTFPPSSSSPPPSSSSPPPSSHDPTSLLSLLRSRFPTLSPKLKALRYHPPNFILAVEEGMLFEKIQQELPNLEATLQKTIGEEVHLKLETIPLSESGEPPPLPMGVERLLQAFPGAQVEIKPRIPG
jgi:DNA polymerase III subunit gamma/tau